MVPSLPHAGAHGRGNCSGLRRQIESDEAECGRGYEFSGPIQYSRYSDAAGVQGWSGSRADRRRCAEGPDHEGPGTPHRISLAYRGALPGAPFFCAIRLFSVFPELETAAQQGIEDFSLWPQRNPPLLAGSNRPTIHLSLPVNEAPSRSRAPAFMRRSWEFSARFPGGTCWTVPPAKVHWSKS